MNLGALTQTNLVAFYLNVYQCMYLHHFFLQINESIKNSEADQGRTVLELVKIKLFENRSHPFFYEIAH